MITIEPMDAADALMLFNKKLRLSENDDHAADLVKTLDYIPLAIVQAAAYISQRGPRYSIDRYLADFEENEHKMTSLLNYDNEQLRRDPEAKNSIVITWQISFEHLQATRSSAADLLSLMSFFDCQGIPEKLLLHKDLQRDSPQDHGHNKGRFSNTFRRFIKGVGRQRGTSKKHAATTPQNNQAQDNIGTNSEPQSTDDFDEDILTLQNYSFISINLDGKTFEMHRLVQLATREWLKAHQQQERWNRQFITNLNAELPIGEYEDWVTYQALFPHAQTALAQKPASHESLIEWATVLYKAASYAWQMGNGSEAEKMSLAALEVRGKVLGQDNNDTLASMSMVGSAYKLGGRWADAEELQVQVMEICKTKLGGDHPDTLTSMANLASTYRNQGRWIDAEELQVQVMEKSKTKLGIDYPDTLTSMANLASTYSNQGRWDDAEKLFVQVMEIFKTKLGVDYPDTLTSMANLASTFSNQGRWDDAEKLEVQVIETRKTKLGVDHPSTLTSMNNLAHIWKARGRVMEAIMLMEECVQALKRVLGLGHPNTVTARRTLDFWKAEQQDTAQRIN